LTETEGGRKGAWRLRRVVACPWAQGQVELNHPTAAESQTLPGIETATAEAMGKARPFAGTHDLPPVPNVVPKTLKEIFALIVE